MYILRVFNSTNFANLEPFAKLFRQKFWHFKFKLATHWRRKRWLYNFKKVGGNYPGTKLHVPDPQGALSKEVPSSLISAANTEMAAVLQPPAAGTKAVKRKYVKISSENKAEIWERAADHGVLAMVQYYTVKLLVTTGTCVYTRPAGNSLIVGVAYLSSAFTKLFQRIFQKQLFAKTKTSKI